MNAWQVCRQLRYLLRAATWPDGVAGPVFSDRVHVTALLPDAKLAQIGFPLAYVAPGAAVTDEQDARLERAALALVLVVRGTGDNVGEAALLGSSRGNGQGSSLGRGLLEVEEAALSAVRALNAGSGVNLRVTSRSAARARDVDGVGYVAQRELALEAVLTFDRTYAPPTRLVATAPGGGAASLTWAVPPARYDRREVVLRRAAGATAPSSPTSGTGVTLSGLLATSKTDTPGAGTWSYALFGGYDELGAGASDRYSSATTVTVVVT